MKRREIKCGEIYWLETKYAIGHQYFKRRPHLVVDSDKYIQVSSMVCVVPLTSNMFNRNGYDFNIARNSDNNLKFDSLAKLDHIYTYDRGRFIYRIGQVEKESMKKIHYYLRKHFNL